MHDKSHTWHIHAPTYDISIMNCVMQANTIPIIQTNHDPVDPLSNFVNYPNIQPMIDSFWNQTDISRPPNVHLSSLPIYSAMYGNWQTLPSIQELHNKLGVVRFENSIQKVCNDYYQWPDGG